jgi:2-succinyl-6-hydroxy-2,4-cyclohexadiene-1-carboxylate synthase
MLHGFAGSHRIFEHLFEELSTYYSIVIPDLPGHGKSELPHNQDISSEYLLIVLNRLISMYRDKNIFLLGYSLGGRLALQFAVKHNAKLSGLILESTTFGLSDSIEKLQRVNLDESLARKIETNYSDFLNDWDNNPVFKTKSELKPERIVILDDIRRLQNPSGLAKMLRGFGTGRMTSCEHELDSITCPVLIITGEYDQKFTAIGKQLHKKIIASTHVIVPQCGHRVHLEDSDAYLHHINTFISNKSLVV